MVTHLFLIYYYPKLREYYNGNKFFTICSTLTLIYVCYFVLVMNTSFYFKRPYESVSYTHLDVYKRQDHDKVTILDALSQAGDLTIYGRRDNVLVMRQEGKTQNVYRIDLANADQLYSSPVFYLQQNDVIYVEPNTRRAKEATELGISFSNPSLWLSAASLLTTISAVSYTHLECNRCPKRVPQHLHY